MRRSIDRMLTTHAGALQRPADLAKTMASEGNEADAVQQRLRTAVADVVAKQTSYGIDIVNDGEYGKSIWQWYITERVDGIERRPWTDDVYFKGRDREQFPDFYAWADESGNLFGFPEDQYFFGAMTTQPVCTGPLSYRPGALNRDIANLANALRSADATEGFMPVVAPASVEVGIANQHYRTEDDFLKALTDVLRQEYRQIAEAGFILQVDDAWLTAVWDRTPEFDLASYREFIGKRIDALNEALTDVPEERVRYHMCWGSWHGPHANDIPLADVVDMMLTVKAGGYLVEAANVRHEHEYRIWEETPLPAGKVLIPGVVSHSCNLIEHPELVAERIERFAQRVGKENVIAGADCGMGGRIHPELGWAKFDSLVRGAELATKRLGY
ncbi:5-methyltetrahydropteroyltriglutamate--homocysteine methyltransferase [Tamaricihabitans halophyticus]|uniref:5-methyltetrahydropteroyltriglutamate--homocysteine methyltransferase n=1 Tax=Tamaricihabitans halophyticus TaxID=1262583 RepID=A0A4R2QUB6_9PSEU|nr:epoxyalkane--coenzyme M transferase [Tamaricihabitans halophyticus]TCP53572.1 5-methyltetrahydropteroyltriglutamate--homocysteine methyltransferase [Tamaricihabitans halophyticus]